MWPNKQQQQPQSYWSTNSALQLPQMTTQMYTGGPNGIVNPGDYTQLSATDLSNLGIGDNSSWFGNTPGLDIAKMGIGGVNSLVGALGAFDMMKTNKLKRKGMEQDIEFAKQARQDRTNFINGTKSAFA